MTNSTPRPIDRIRALIDHAPTCDTDPYRADDLHDLLSLAARDLLCDIDDPCDDYPSDSAFRAAFSDLRDAIRALIDDPFFRDDLFILALEFSLCPIHMIDYQSCFDDADDE